ncbi:MAG: lipase family protein [Psychromonas sp.]|nr:lipase family protein [Psychromonas sp.]
MKNKKSMMDNLNCRFLNASQLAYDINMDGSFSPHQSYYNAVDFIKEPTIISGGINHINAAIVGTCNDCVIVIFRGTQNPAPHLPIILDWLQDFLVNTISCNNLPGMVHKGFYDALISIWKPLLVAIKTQIACGKPLYITGHSKGGPMATLTAMLLNNIEGIKAQKVVTIGSPNVGDGAFKEKYEAIFTQKSFINHLDIVPFIIPAPNEIKRLEKLPIVGKIFKNFAKLNYQPVGQGLYINKTGKITSEAEHPTEYSLDMLNNLEDIETTFERLDLNSIISAHDILAPDTKYQKGICQNIECKTISEFSQNIKVAEKTS